MLIISQIFSKSPLTMCILIAHVNVVNRPCQQGQVKSEPNILIIIGLKFLGFSGIKSSRASITVVGL